MNRDLQWELPPFGSLAGGTLAAWIGAPYTVALAGIASIGAAVFFYSKLPLIREQARPIYVEKGIIIALPGEFD